MLDELDHYFEEFERSVEEAVRSSVNTGARAFSKPVVAGMAMGFGPEGKPRIQFFGDNLIGPDGFRAPIYEQVLDEKEGNLRLLVELPGVEKEDVQISALEDKVTLEAAKGERMYSTDDRPAARHRPRLGRGVLQERTARRGLQIKGQH